MYLNLPKFLIMPAAGSVLNTTIKKIIHVTCPPGRNIGNKFKHKL